MRRLVAISLGAVGCVQAPAMITTGPSSDSIPTLVMPAIPVRKEVVIVRQLRLDPPDPVTCSTRPQQATLLPDLPSSFAYCATPALFKKPTLPWRLALPMITR